MINPLAPQHMENKEALLLIEKYLNGTANDQERALLESFLMTRMDLPGNTASPEFLERAFLENYQRILQRTQLSAPLRSPSLKGASHNPYRISLVAAAMVLITLGIYFLAVHHASRQPALMNNHQELLVDIPGGGNRAVLTLPNGTSLHLSSTQEGIVIHENDIQYLDGTPISDDALSHKHHSEEANSDNYLSLSTPRGGQYQVILPDGTQVWLNAASTLRYPAHFGTDRRIVELEGEGYFNVTHRPNNQTNIPFIVRSRRQEVRVLGTEFNIQAYPDEQAIRTTLINGKVKVSGGVPEKQGTDLLLKPSEQAVLFVSGEMQKERADLAEAAAWKKGVFYFKNTPFEEMMQQIARWYDIEVIYQSSIPRESFSGEMSRKVSLRTVLHLLNTSEIDFQIKGNKLIID